MPTRVSYVADSVEPVTAAEAKLAARVDGGELDDLINGYIAAAREAAEHITGRCYRPQVLRTELADWPAAGDAIAVHQATACVARRWDGTQFAAVAGGTFVFAPGGIGNNGTVLAPLAGTNWPDPAGRPVGPRVQIDLTAGPASPADVPEQVKTYIKATVAAWVNNGDALIANQLASNPLFERLLDSERLWA